jgi:cytochrome c
MFGLASTKGRRDGVKFEAAWLARQASAGRAITQICVVLMALLLVACDEGQKRDATGETLYTEGRIAFKRLCASCHELRTRVHLTGPYLVGIEDRRAAGLKGYDYSPAMREFGLSWDTDTLDAFLADPRTTIPGTKMAIEPIDDPDKRAAIIYYITQR